MPLSLQLICQQAGVGANPILLLVLLLWYTVSAAIRAICMPCRSASMNPSQHLRADTLAYDVQRLGWLAQLRNTPMQDIQTVACVLLSIH